MLSRRQLSRGRRVRPLDHEQALTVGARLAHEGVIGRFAIDFVVVRDADGVWRSYAIEINLRKGGTTHPFLALQLLTGGSYDPEQARFTVPDGGCRHMVATDHLKIAQLRDLSLDELLSILDRRGLRFDHASGAGVVLHMLSAASDAGRLGLTAIADTPDAAARLAERVAAVLLEQARAASAPVRAPARASGLLGLPALVPGSARG
ncbi:MAG: hypothetical protein QOJ63_2873 [Solirubrobacteraceae bacterium]|nr:hypothetical protein [Solirubrobacteraceae bacterium]